MIAPAFLNNCTTFESFSGSYANKGQVAVVLNPLAPMLSLTATGTPYNGKLYLFPLVWRAIHCSSKFSFEITEI